ncbi:MAG TPA: type IV toxin-antitoxin system AbiEi family antitoxin domain-containing protein [Acidothermaceae bacterium]|nr:type IV toxin-antitoxin system AbiEi family antitoxin domain-containing protein [Acidothermaceae bacterium]
MTPGVLGKAVDDTSAGDAVTATMLDMPLAPKLFAVAATQGGAFKAEQALAAGYARNEIARLQRSGEWVRLRRGVYVERAALPGDNVGRHVLTLRGALLTVGGQAAASHLTSAVLHDVALLDADLSLVHVTRGGGASSRVASGIRYHDAALPPSHLTKVDGLLATNAARTIVDLTRTLPFDAALVAAESALNLKLTTLAELDEVLAYCVDWPGARNAGRVIAFASPYSESPGETLCRIAFDALGVPQPHQQVYIFDKYGLIARCDYFWEEFHTIGEFDGKVKYVGAKARDNSVLLEKKREDRLRDAGLEVCRFEWAESRNRSESVQHKAFSAFGRAANRRAPRDYRFKLQPPAR